MSWTQERVEKLKTLWSEGLTASQIAKELGEGVSRNAVIGKVHRLGLSTRSTTGIGAAVEQNQPKPATEPAVAEIDVSMQKKVSGGAAKCEEREVTEPTAPKEAETKTDQTALAEASDEAAPEEQVNPIAALAAEVERNARQLSLLELNERTCKWPIGDPSTDDFYFCGLPCAPDKPYCSAHVAVAYQPLSSRRDRERDRARAKAAG